MIFMFYKEKGFYISLLAGIIAIVAFSVICLNTVGVKNGGDEPPTEDNLLAYATSVPDEKPPTIVDSQAEEVSKVIPAATASPVTTKTPKPKAVKTTKTKNAMPKLHFNQEKGLLWPVSGSVLLEYSPDRVIYFKTLAQYRTNDGMIIESKVGENVKSSTNGVVTNIVKNDELGTILTMSIGNEFTVSYGQLKNVKLKKGDSVKEGQVIGKIAKPTKYYSVEGPNLFYQVKSGKDTVNPMVLLR